MLTKKQTQIKANKIFHTKFLEAWNKHAATKFLTKNEIKSSDKPWLTKDILTSIKIKRKLFHKYRLSYDNKTSGKL